MSTGIPLTQMIDMVEGTKSSTGVSQMVDDVLAGSFARSTPTVPGDTGRIQAGTYMLLRMVDSADPRLSRIHSIPPLAMSLTMLREINRYPLQPFHEALTGFNKQAKKFRKRF